MSRSIDPRRVCGEWARRQALAPRTSSTPAGKVHATGWLRTLGGIDAYLALRARLPEFSMAEVHAAIAAGELRVSPAARGCIYLVPQADLALALRMADLLSRRRNARELEKVGVPESEIEAIGDAVLAALDAPLTTAEVRKALPDGLVRSLGAVGKKVGLSSPLPSALRALDFAGHI
ncbi:MAG: winged helix DNA-binding domain-containing protein [Myxococcales bacterium]|nr:winged helix DNA-binding domain-containing protein [Myxococcales bacterium]